MVQLLLLPAKQDPGVVVFATAAAGRLARRPDPPGSHIDHSFPTIGFLVSVTLNIFVLHSRRVRKMHNISVFFLFYWVLLPRIQGTCGS